MPSPSTPLVVMVSGFWPGTSVAVAEHLCRGEPSARLIPYENPDPDHFVRVGHGTVARDRPNAAALSTAVVRDLLDIAARPGAPNLIAVLPPSFEPDQLRSAWNTHATPAGPRLGTMITAVPADLLLDGLTNEDTVRSVGLHQGAADERSIGDVVARQLEQADVVVTAGQPAGDDDWEAEQMHLLLHLIAPWAGHLDADDDRLSALLVRPTRRPLPLSPVTQGLRGMMVGDHQPIAERGVISCVFHARRPFHPGRLHRALDDVTDRVLRSRGHFWLASRPDLVLSWECTATLSIGPVSGWLADLPDELWSDVDAQRRVTAAFDWDPYYGDRNQHLAFIGLDIDPAAIHRTLTGCLLTDEELSHGEDTWQHFPDPFERAYLTPAVGRAARSLDDP